MENRRRVAEFFRILSNKFSRVFENRSQKGYVALCLMLSFGDINRAVQVSSRAFDPGSILDAIPPEARTSNPGVNFQAPLLSCLVKNVLSIVTES